MSSRPRAAGSDWYFKIPRCDMDCFTWQDPCTSLGKSSPWMGTTSCMRTGGGAHGADLNPWRLKPSHLLLASGGTDVDLRPSRCPKDAPQKTRIMSQKKKGRFGQNWTSLIVYCTYHFQLNFVKISKMVPQSPNIQTINKSPPRLSQIKTHGSWIFQSAPAGWAAVKVARTPWSWRFWTLTHFYRSDDILVIVDTAWYICV